MHGPHRSPARYGAAFRPLQQRIRGGLRSCVVVSVRVSGCTAKDSGAQVGRFSPVGHTVSEVDDAASACTNNDGQGGVTKRSVDPGWWASRRRRLGGGEEVSSRGGSVTAGDEAARAAWWRIDGAAQQRRTAAGCAVGKQVKATGAFGAAAADGWRWADEQTAGLLGVILVTPHPSRVLGSKALASRVLKHSVGRGQVAWAVVGAGSARGCISAASATHSGWPPVLRGRIDKGQRVHGQSFRLSSRALRVHGATRVG